MFAPLLWMTLCAAFADDPGAASPPEPAQPATEAEAPAPAVEEPPPQPSPEGALEIKLGAIKVKRRELPGFPAGDFPKGVAVECALTVVVGADGLPISADAGTSCPEPFAQASEDAYMKWRWRPYEVDGEPVKVWFETATLFVP